MQNGARTVMWADSMNKEVEVHMASKFTFLGALVQVKGRFGFKDGSPVMEGLCIEDKTLTQMM